MAVLVHHCDYKTTQMTYTGHRKQRFFFTCVGLMALKVTVHCVPTTGWLICIACFYCERISTMTAASWTWYGDCSRNQSLDVQQEQQITRYLVWLAVVIPKTTWERPPASHNPTNHHHIGPIYSPAQRIYKYKYLRRQTDRQKWNKSPKNNSPVRIHTIL